MKINFNENRSTELANFDIEFSEGFVAKGVKLISGKDGKPDFLTHSYSYKVEKDEKGNG